MARAKVKQKEVKMTFRKKNLDLGIDLGETNLENLFIDLYMKQANEVQLKVYILGLYFSEKKDTVYDIYTIAEKLSIKPNEVLDAFKYWSSKGLITISERKINGYDTSYKFIYNGTKNLYLKSVLNIEMESNKSSLNVEAAREKTPQVELRILRDRECIDFFNELEAMISAPVTQHDREKIAKIISTIGSSYEMIKEAYKITYIDKQIRDSNAIRYIESILSNWSREKINTKQELIENFKIKKELINSLGINSNLIKTSALSSFLIKWRPLVESDSLLITIARYSAKKSNSPTIDRLEGLLNKISENYPLSSEGFKRYIEDDKNRREQRAINKQTIDKHRVNKDYENPDKEETDFLLKQLELMRRSEYE